MLRNVKRYAMQTEDWLRYHPALRSALSRYKVWRDLVSRPRDDQGLARSIIKLCAAARLASSRDAERRIQDKILRRVHRLDARAVDWSEFVSHVDGRHRPRAALVQPF